MLLWLTNNPSAAELRENVENERFRMRLIEYLEEIIKEDLSWINSSVTDSYENNNSMSQ